MHAIPALVAGQVLHRAWPHAQKVRIWRTAAAGTACRGAAPNRGPTRGWSGAASPAQLFSLQQLANCGWPGLEWDDLFGTGTCMAWIRADDVMTANLSKANT